MAHLDTERWLKDLQHDREQLELPHLYAKDVTIRSRCQTCETQGAHRFRKLNNPQQIKKEDRIARFWYLPPSQIQLTYLYGALKRWATEELDIHIAMVSGGTDGNKTTFGSSEFSNILTNFSPNSKKRHLMKTMPQDKEIDLLIGTDCISEGQNLQDCDYLINYDIHWNPVRIIQRFGRIDRIGNTNDSIQLVNFWPTPDLNRYIKLKKPG